MTEYILLNSFLTVFAVAIGIVNLVYVYYWIAVIFATKNRHISNENITDIQLEKEFIKAIHRNTPYNFLVQITTKGNAIDVVTRGIDNILEAVDKYPILKKYITVEVATEKRSEVTYLAQRHERSPIPVVGFLIPQEYKTPNKTLLKARALHYMIERHRERPKENCYVVHYDEESVFTPDNLARLIHSLLVKPIDISEGSISYGLDWNKASIACRVMESNRPFGCHECYMIMTNPPPYHLHGSNMVVNQKLENEIGWDIGRYEGNALIAEDLVFGLQAYLKYGKQAFGWHRAEMIEQPPFTIGEMPSGRERDGYLELYRPLTL